MTEFKMPPLARSPGLSPSPRTEEPAYPLPGALVGLWCLRIKELEAERDELRTANGLLRQENDEKCRGCEINEAERDAALARAEKAEARAALRTAERDRALEALRTIALAGRYDAFEPSVMAALANEPKEIGK
jgi:hypothetical protein